LPGNPFPMMHEYERNIWWSYLVDVRDCSSIT
jgi:hypothetical protein